MLIIDGHNLIPHVAGLSLSDLDDEQRLIAMLQQYARQKRKKVRVYFDKAAPGHAGERSFGSVRAVFVPAASTADAAIEQYLREMKKGARAQASVVSSDNRVKHEARSRGASVIESYDFARMLEEAAAAASAASAAAGAKTEPAPNVDEYLALFGVDPDEAERPIMPEAAPRSKAPAGKKLPDRKKPPARKRRYHGFAPKDPPHGSGRSE